MTGIDFCFDERYYQCLSLHLKKKWFLWWHFSMQNICDPAVLLQNCYFIEITIVSLIVYIPSEACAWLNCFFSLDTNVYLCLQLFYSQIPNGVQHGQLLVLRGKGVLRIAFFFAFCWYLTYTWRHVDPFQIWAGLPKPGFLVNHGNQYVRFRIHLPT